MPQSMGNPWLDRMQTVGWREAIEFTPNVAKAIYDCITQGKGLPQFQTHVGGDRFKGENGQPMVLLKCYGGAKGGHTWFKNVPLADVEKMEQTTGDWKWITEKYGTLGQKALLTQEIQIPIQVSPREAVINRIVYDGYDGQVQVWYSDTDVITDYFHFYTVRQKKAIEWIQRDGADTMIGEMVNYRYDHAKKALRFFKKVKTETGKTVKPDITVNYAEYATLEEAKSNFAEAQEKFREIDQEPAIYFVHIGDFETPMSDTPYVIGTKGVTWTAWKDVTEEQPPPPPQPQGYQPTEGDSMFLEIGLSNADIPEPWEILMDTKLSLLLKKKVPEHFVIAVEYKHPVFYPNFGDERYVVGLHTTHYVDKQKYLSTGGAFDRVTELIRRVDSGNISSREGENMKGKWNTRPLTTTEGKWTMVRHKESGTIATILGTHGESFDVYVPKENHKLALSWVNLDEWEVIYGDPNEPHTARWFQEDYDGEIKDYHQTHHNYQEAYLHMVGLHNSAQYIGKHFQVISITPEGKSVDGREEKSRLDLKPGVPSVKTIQDGLKIDGEKAKTIRGLFDGSIDVETHSNLWEKEPYVGNYSDAEKILYVIDKLIGGFGVEAITGDWVDSYHQNIQLSYVNKGETYATTVIRDNLKGRWIIGDWGTIVEYEPHRFSPKNPVKDMRQSTLDLRQRMDNQILFTVSQKGDAPDLEIAMPRDIAIRQLRRMNYPLDDLGTDPFGAGAIDRNVLEDWFKFIKGTKNFMFVSARDKSLVMPEKISPKEIKGLGARAIVPETTETGCKITRGFSMAGSFGGELSVFERMLKKGFIELYYDAPYYWGVINIPEKKIFTYTEGDTTLIECPTAEKLTAEATAHIDFLKESGYGKISYGEWDDVLERLQSAQGGVSAKTPEPVTVKLPVKFLDYVAKYIKPYLGRDLNEDDLYFFKYHWDDKQWGPRVGYSELAMHYGIAGKGIQEVRWRSARSVEVFVEGKWWEGLPQELLPHELRKPPQGILSARQDSPYHEGKPHSQLEGAIANYLHKKGRENWSVEDVFIAGFWSIPTGSWENINKLIDRLTQDPADVSYTDHLETKNPAYLVESWMRRVIKVFSPRNGTRPQPEPPIIPPEPIRSIKRCVFLSYTLGATLNNIRTSANMFVIAKEMGKGDDNDLRDAKWAAKHLEQKVIPALAECGINIHPITEQLIDIELEFDKRPFGQKNAMRISQKTAEANDAIGTAMSEFVHISPKVSHRLQEVQIPANRVRAYFIPKETKGVITVGMAHKTLAGKTGVSQPAYMPAGTYKIWHSSESGTLLATAEGDRYLTIQTADKLLALSQPPEKLSEEAYEQHRRYREQEYELGH